MLIHTSPVFTQDEVVKLQERIAAIMAAGGKDFGGKDVDGSDQDSLRALKGSQTPPRLVTFCTAV